MRTVAVWAGRFRRVIQRAIVKQSMLSLSRISGDPLGGAIVSEAPLLFFLLSRSCTDGSQQAIVDQSAETVQVQRAHTERLRREDESQSARQHGLNQLRTNVVCPLRGSYNADHKRAPQIDVLSSTIVLSDAILFHALIGRSTAIMILMLQRILEIACGYT